MVTTTRILMTGSREFDDRNVALAGLLSASALLGVPAGGQSVSLVHGAARGADTLCAEIAEELGWGTEPHPAQWQTHTAQCPPAHQGQSTCKMAGHRRNAEMIATAPELLIAFPTQRQGSGGSRGTWGCAEAGVRAGLPTFIVWAHRLFPWGEHSAALMRRHLDPFADNPATLFGVDHSVALADIHPLPF